MSTIHGFRLSIKLSQTEFAERLGISAESYRMWDSGRRDPPVLVLAKVRELADAGLSIGHSGSSNWREFSGWVCIACEKQPGTDD